MCVAMSGENLSDLASETAAVLLNAIKAGAEQYTTPGCLEQLANAYATVREAAPRRSGRAASL